MEEYVYHVSGNPVGLHNGDILYDLQGNLWGS